MSWKSFQEGINACLTKPPGSRVLLTQKVIDFLLFGNAFIFNFVKI